MNWKCEDHSLVGVDGRRVRVTALRCRRWSCEFCAPRLRRRMVARALAGFVPGQRVRMFTLTSPASDTVEQSYDQLALRWKRLREHLRRDFPRLRFEYFKVIERQQRGHAHLHVLSRGGFIPQAWLATAAAKAGFGWVADIREVGRQVAKYVAKYLGKEMGAAAQTLRYPALPRWHRRASWSRAWAPAFQTNWLRWMADQQLLDVSWQIANGTPARTAYRLASLGYEVLALDAGHQQDALPGQLVGLDRVRWRSAGANHRPCWLCDTGHPASRRRHVPDWEPIPPAPPLMLVLWPAP